MCGQGVDSFVTVHLLRTTHFSVFRTFFLEAAGVIFESSHVTFQCTFSRRPENNKAFAKCSGHLELV